MSKFMILVKKLYQQKVKSKSFILMTILYIAIISAVSFWSDIKAFIFNDEPDQFAILNSTDYAMDSIFVNDTNTKWTFIASLNDKVKQQLEDGDYIAAIEFSEVANKLAANIVSFDPLPLTDQQDIAAQINNAGQMYAISKLNLTDEQAASLLDSTPSLKATTLNQAATDGKSADEKEAGVWVSYLVGIIIYFFITTFLSMITTDVASEKGSRALEMLLVSVKPETHFRSKLVGVFLVAITQVGIITVLIISLLKFTDDGAKWTFVLDVVEDLSISYVFYVLAFLFVTIFLFLIMGALFGSLVSKVEEASQVMMPAIMTTLIGFYVMISGLSNPDTLLIKIFSYIPFTSGMVMPMRIGATDIATFEPILSLLVLIISAIALYLLSLSFYKRSVLTYSTGGIIQKIKTVFKVTT